eukprot:g243.t1
MSSELVHNESLLDLLTRQRTRNEAGVRLSFHQDLLEHVSFQLSPLHYAAVTGNTTLVCYLYKEGFKTRNITVASFAAGGRNGSTSWRIPVTVSPSVAASLAGHPTTAIALKQFEKGIPLHWDRTVHRSFQHEEFRRKARKQMRLLLESPWFYALPAPVRVKLTDELMTNLSRVHVWGFLDKEIWNGDWETLIGKELIEAANNFNCESPKSTSQLRGRQFPPQYQFNVGQVGNDPRRRQVCGVFNFARRAFVGSSWWLVQKWQGGNVPLLSAIGMFVASGFHNGLQLGLPLVLSLLSGTEISSSSSSLPENLG